MSEELEDSAPFETDSTAVGAVDAVGLSPEAVLPIHVPIDPLSLSSLYLKLYANGGTQFLSNGTGFVVRHGADHFLITNSHVLTGRHSETGELLSKTAAFPDQVRIGHHKAEGLGRWIIIKESLFKPDGSPRWRSHPGGSEFDVVALPLQSGGAKIRLFPLNLALADVDIALYPSMPISVIGFPLGLRPNGFFPIWKTGHVAGDAGIPYQGRPAFLIDATTRHGMSGSPVVARTVGGHMTSKGYRIGGVETRFLGVYSGRIHKDVEVGCVWRPEVIHAVLNNPA